MSEKDEWDSQPEELRRVLLELERLRHADVALRGRPNWLKARRLAIFAECCKDREPLIEVMNTDPPCVLVGQVTYSEDAITKFDEGSERERWQGAGRARGSQGFVWLSTFERMAERGVGQWVWCRHRRGWIAARDVVTQRGRRIITLTDKRGRTGHMR